jgi:hypothetical protein
MVSIDRPLNILYISADFKKIFKGPPPFKQKKMFLSGLTTSKEALLNQRGVRR